MAKSKKSEEREPIAMQNFPEEPTIAGRLFRELDPDDLFPEIERQTKKPIEEYGLSTADPEKLYHHERLNHQYEWPDHVRAAVDAFYSLHQAKRCMQSNDAKWAVHHVLHALRHISLYNVLRFEDQITLGDSLIVAQSQGGKTSGAKRQEKAAADEAIIVAAAKKLLADGKQERDLVGILKQTLPFKETKVREALKKNGLHNGAAGIRKGKKPQSLVTARRHA